MWSRLWLNPWYHANQSSGFQPQGGAFLSSYFGCISNNRCKSSVDCGLGQRGTYVSARSITAITSACGLIARARDERPGSEYFHSSRGAPGETKVQKWTDLSCSATNPKMPGPTTCVPGEKSSIFRSHVWTGLKVSHFMRYSSNALRLSARERFAAGLSSNPEVKRSTWYLV